MSSALYNIWAVTVGVSVTGKLRSLRLMFLFVVFVWYCSAIGTVFQTFLRSFLVNPGYEIQLTSLEEILDSGIQFVYPEIFSQSFAVSSVLRHKEVFEIREKCTTYEVCIDRIRETGNFASFIPVWVVQNYTNFINDHGTICLLNVGDYDFFFVTTYVQEGSFFLEPLNKYITLSVESGILEKALTNSVYVPKPARNAIDDSDGYFVFTFSHLHIAFYILLFVHCLSFLLFLCEVFYHYRLRYF